MLGHHTCAFCAPRGFDEDGTPILPAYSHGPNEVVVPCVPCGQPHLHGAGDGYRAAHCIEDCDNVNSPYMKTEYFLRLVGDFRFDPDHPCPFFKTRIGTPEERLKAIEPLLRFFLQE